MPLFVVLSLPRQRRRRTALVAAGLVAGLGALGGSADVLVAVSALG